MTTADPHRLHYKTVTAETRSSSSSKMAEKDSYVLSRNHLASLRYARLPPLLPRSPSLANSHISSSSPLLYPYALYPPPLNPKQCCAHLLPFLALFKQAKHTTLPPPRPHIVPSPPVHPKLPPSSFLHYYYRNRRRCLWNRVCDLPSIPPFPVFILVLSSG